MKQKNNTAIRRRRHPASVASALLATCLLALATLAACSADDDLTDGRHPAPGDPGTIRFTATIADFTDDAARQPLSPCFRGSTPEGGEGVIFRNACKLTPPSASQPPPLKQGRSPYPERGREFFPPAPSSAPPTAAAPSRKATASTSSPTSPAPPSKPTTPPPTTTAHGSPTSRGKTSAPAPRSISTPTSPRCRSANCPRKPSTSPPTSPPPGSMLPPTTFSYAPSASNKATTR